jgi:hypothetical protein
MKLSHRDINGKTIHIGDVIVVHYYLGIDNMHSISFPFYDNIRFGEIGVVEKFGCIGVRLEEDTKYVHNPITYFEDYWVEVIGKL